MSSHSTHGIRLHPTAEFEALPAYSTISEMFSDGSERARCELVPASRQSASAWYPEAVASFGGNLAPSWWSDDPIIESASVCLFRLRDAYFVPAFGIVFSNEGEVMMHSMAQAAAVTPGLALLPHTERRGEETIISLPNDVHELDRIIVSMPWGAITNYGHFVLDCLPTIASLVDEPELDAYTFAFPPLSPWQRRHLELLGLEDPLELELVSCGEILHASDVVWSNCMAGFIHRPNTIYRAIRDKQLARKKPTLLSFEKVYVTRRGFVSPDGTTKRTFLSEETLERRLEQLGFVVVNPVQYTIDEQIDIFRHADVVVGCSGAGLGNVLYCQRGATVVEITPMRMTAQALARNLWVFKICSIVGCKWRPYYCADNPPENLVFVAGVEQAELGGFSFDLDVEDLIGYIEAL